MCKYPSLDLYLLTWLSGGGGFFFFLKAGIGVWGRGEERVDEDEDEGLGLVVSW